MNLNASRNDSIKVQMKPIEREMMKPLKSFVEKTKIQKQIIKTETKPSHKMTMTAKKPVAEVKIDLSSTQVLRSSKFSIPTKPTMVSSKR